MQTWTVKELREALSDPRMDENAKVTVYQKGPGINEEFDLGYDKEKKELTIEN